MVLERNDFSHERGAIDVRRGASVGPNGRLHAKKGAFEAFRSVSDSYDLYGGAHVQKREIKAMGRPHRRTVGPHCDIRVI